MSWGGGGGGDLYIYIYLEYKRLKESRIVLENRS